MADKVIGILGGVGPWATLEMFKRFLEAVPAKRDQDYPRLIIYCNSKIPDRNKSILGEGESSITALQETAQALERAGADFIVIGSNGTHYYYDEIQESVRIPVLNMIQETVNILKTQYSKLKKFGLIAATCTVSKGIYQEYFSSTDQSLVTPNNKLQKKVLDAIYEVKIGRLDTSRQSFIEVSKNLIDQGAEGIICGCTEVSVVLHEKDINVPVIDPMQVAAEKAIGIGQNRSMNNP